MSLTATDFIYPQGELIADFFPDTLTTDLGVWIGQAVGLTDDVERQRAYVYYRAYAYLCSVQAKEYAGRTLGPASYTRFESQLAEFPRLRDYWKAKYEVEADDAHRSSSPQVTIAL
jgi:hypothetical protein